MAYEPEEIPVPDCWPQRLQSMARQVNVAYHRYCKALAQVDERQLDAAKDRAYAAADKAAAEWNARNEALDSAIARHNARQEQQAASVEVQSEEQMAYRVELALRAGGRPDGQPGAMYDASTGVWFLWKNGGWQRDKVGMILALIREIVADITPTAKWNQIKVHNALRARLQTTPGMVTDGSDWDADPFLLGVPGGVVDLRTGKLREAGPEDLVTMYCAVTPIPGEPVRWLQFLQEATGGDAEYVRALQKLAGYCLTGSVAEETLTFIYGPGGNGKGVFLDVLSGVLGYYAVAAPETLIEARSESAHPTDMATLRRKRLAFLVETESAKGARWNDTRVKKLTGGDVISARVMRGDFFEFAPTHKLIVAGNHAPKLSAIGDAMRRRVRVFPFTRTPQVKDIHLKAKLREEWPQILQWAIEGCLMWQREGLGAFTAQEEATADFFEAQDTLADWIEELCERVVGGFSSYRMLLSSYNDYRRHAGMFPVEQRVMVEELKAKGFNPDKGAKGVRGFRGLCVVRQLSWDGGDCKAIDKRSEPSDVVPNKVVPFGDDAGQSADVIVTDILQRMKEDTRRSTGKGE